MVVVGDLKHIYFIVFSVTLLIYANPALSQLVGECLIIITKKKQYEIFNLNYETIMDLLKRCVCVCIYVPKRLRLYLVCYFIK